MIVLFGRSLVMNSMFVRNTLNASFIILRLPSSTATISFSFRLFPFFLLLFFTSLLSMSGISPTMGVAMFSRSLRPLTLVLESSFMTRMTAGTSKPSSNALVIAFFFSGAVGSRLPVGGVIMRVLYALNACDNWFSSRF